LTEEGRMQELNPGEQPFQDAAQNSEASGGQVLNSEATGGPTTGAPAPGGPATGAPASGGPTLSRRGFIAGALGASAALVATGGEVLLTGCSSKKNQAETLVSKAVADKDIPVVEVSPDHVVEATDFEEVPLDEYVELVATHDLPVGTLSYQIDSTSALILFPGEDTVSFRRIGLLDLESGEYHVIINRPIGTKRNMVIYDARASRTRVIWVEVDLGDLSWKTYVAPLADGQAGTAVLVEEGNADYEPPMLAVAEDKVYWTFMPMAAGKANQEDSMLRALTGNKAFSSGLAEPETVLVSHGRMITNPQVTDGLITVTPRVDTANVYYQLTALNCSDNKAVAFLVMPQSLRVSDAIYANRRFSFGIEDNYSYAGGLASSGIYQQLMDGVYYLHVSKPPTNAMVLFGDCLVVKSTSSIIGIDTFQRKLFIIKPPLRCADFGETLIGNGIQDRIVTSSVRMKDGGKGPDAVMIRIFDKVSW